jgi:DNA processing protein
MIRYGDPQYPKLLESIAAPPIILNVLGNLDGLLTKPGVAVIGTRQPSSFGRQIGERIGYRLGESGINVISGLAIGCDTAGHTGCLQANGMTTAIVAHGLDTVYPKENKPLFQSILENNGCIVSEYMVKTRSLPTFFVERDRIQAGLSVATFVIETDVKGGTMHAGVEMPMILTPYDRCKVTPLKWVVSMMKESVLV